jgi:hypothetical protein
MSNSRKKAIFEEFGTQTFLKGSTLRESGTQSFLRGVSSQGIRCTKVFERGAVSSEGICCTKVFERGPFSGNQVHKGF